MRRFAVAFLSLVFTLGIAAAWDDPVVEYLSTRDRLAPAPVSSRISLQQVLSSGDFAHVEFVGTVAGKASAVCALSNQPPRTLMMTLDDGTGIDLRAGVEIDALQVGHRVAVIASTKRVLSSDELTLETWIYAWDLPRDPEPVEEEPAVETAPAAQPPPTNPETLRSPSAVPDTSTVALPQPTASGISEADAVEIWKTWVLELNSKLSQQQARDIVRWVLHYSQEYSVNHKLIFALIKWESWFNPSCVSHAGAIGLMQLMPGTARGLGVNPRNVQQNIQGGTRYLAEQLGKYRDRDNYQRVILALACYNAGPNAVKRAGHRVPNIRETQSYVKKVSNTFYELHEAQMP